MNFKIGDLVSRISHNHDIVFKIASISSDKVYLKGLDFRLYADASIDDLVSVGEVSREDDEIIQKNVRELKIDRSNYFYLPGRVLHIDADIHLNNKVAKPYKIRVLTKLGNHKKSLKRQKIGNFY